MPDPMATTPPPNEATGNLLRALSMWLPDIYGKLYQQYNSIRSGPSVLAGQQPQPSGFAGQNKSGARSLFDFLGSIFGGSLPNPEQLPPQRSSTLPAPEQLPYSRPTPLGQQPPAQPIVPTVNGQGLWLYGMQQPGNIDLTQRPIIQTREGPATVRSAGFGIDGKEVLLPTVGNGREWSDDEAVAEYRRTGKHLGIFQNPQGSTEYGQELHKAYESGQIPDYGNQDEQGFQQWYQGWAKRTGIDLNPDHPLHKYDYRAAYHAGVEPQISPKDGKYHWPSQFKAWDHPNRYVDGIDTITGKPAPNVRKVE